MDRLLLYGSRDSGHAYKARLFLALASVPHDYENVDLDVPRDLRPERFRAVARFGEVPVLVHDAMAIVQSNAILLHLARHTGRFPPAPDELLVRGAPQVRLPSDGPIGCSERDAFGADPNGRNPVRSR
jgi:glutathione S-transferase